VNLDPIQFQGFDDQKLKKKKIQLKFLFIYLFSSKIAIYLSLGLHKVSPSDRRSLLPSNENIQHFKKCNYELFSILVGQFCPPGSGFGYGSRDHIESGPQPSSG
jgi:hypothetical protein